MNPIRVVIVDDENLHLQRLSIILDGEDDFQVAGAFLNADEAMGALAAEECDLLLTDIHMPQSSGLAFISKAHKDFPELRIIALTADDDIQTVMKALKEGAIGYLLKSESASKLCGRIRDTLAGGASLSPKITRTLINQLQEEPMVPHTNLSSREREILIDAAKGLTYQETADRLGISIHTIHHHVKNIFEKLGVRNKAEALQSAQRKGLI